MDDRTVTLHFMLWSGHPLVANLYPTWWMSSGLSTDSSSTVPFPLSLRPKLWRSHQPAVCSSQAISSRSISALLRKKVLKALILSKKIGITEFFN